MLRGSLISVSEIEDRGSLFTLMERHYAGVDRSRFEKDLDGKDGLIVLKDGSGITRGFSTYRFIDTRYRGKEITVLFSGDTVIDRDYWGDSALFRNFGKLLYKMSTGGGEPYWFLITQGVRTYQMLPLFFKQFYPSVEQATPADIEGLIRHLAELVCPGAFDAARGVITSEAYHLREYLAEVPRNKLESRHVRFFLEKNPGWMKGDELACVCELSSHNMKRSALRLIRDWDY
jgi:hypothetical protein